MRNISTATLALSPGSHSINPHPMRDLPIQDPKTYLRRDTQSRFGTSRKMLAFNREQLKVCQDAFDTIVAEKTRYGFSIDKAYLSIAIMELYRNGFRSRQSLEKIAGSLPLERRSHRLTFLSAT